MGGSFASYAYPDTASVELRSFDQEKIEEYRADTDYAYGWEDPTDSWWESFKEWLFSLIRSVFKGVSNNAISTFFRILFWSLGIFAVFMVVRSLLVQGAFGVFSRSNPQEGIDYEDLESNPQEVDWQELIRVEVERTNYKTAVRFLYLFTVQELWNQGLIDWKKDKTNREYMRELKKVDLHQSFRQLTHSYEYVWFGDFAIDKAHFSQLNQLFLTFQSEAGRVEKV